jgi:hypothetical protein
VRRPGPLDAFLRRSGVLLTGVAAGKVLLIDTAHLDLGHRAGVFLAVGLILLAGAYVYTRLTAAPEEAAA